MEKYGFVYIWYDRKHRRYYIGSHWGTEDDGYVCSSDWMRHAYRKRPQDFKRRIVMSVATSRTELFTEEQRWLNMIKDDELRHRYYNLKKVAGGHWTANEFPQTTLEKMALSIKKKFKEDPEYRAKVGKAMRGKKFYNNGVKERAFNEDNRIPEGFTLGRLSGKCPSGWNKGIPRTEEQKAEHSKKLKRKYECEEIVPWNKGNGKPKKERERFPKKWLSFKCQHCDKIFEVSDDIVKRAGEPKFCCWECRKDHTQVKKTCERCGKEFRVKPYRATKYNVRFCSKECQFPK